MGTRADVYRNLVHRLFDEEISTVDLLNEVSPEAGQMILPPLSAPDSVMAREKACSARALPGITLRDH